MECPVCSDNSAQHLDTAGDGVETQCRRCGRFKYTSAAWERLRNATPERRSLVCGWLWENNRFGSVPTISQSNIDALLSARPLPFVEKAKRLLIHLSDESDQLGKPLELSSMRLDSMLQTLNHDDVGFVGRYLVKQGLLEDVPGNWWRLTGTGFLRADEWKQTVVASIQGFVAMWFDTSMSDVWENGLRRGIADAGYKPLRIDNKEHANKICDEIISEIRRSRFVVADYTGHRGGVYYEAGYATGRDLPVILTCRKDELDKLHLDIRQYNCIDWQSPEELAGRLKVRIEAVIGDGPMKGLG